MTKTRLAIGLMSGTSMDGIDGALIRTDGEGQLETIGHAVLGYSGSERELIQQALIDAATLDPGVRGARTEAMSKAEMTVTSLHARVVSDLLNRLSLPPEEIDVIGFHGQTVLHRPEQHRTIQLGDGDWLANTTGIDVIYDFRSQDVSAGGQGAPLVPIYHMALVKQASLEYPVAVVNLGGVGNVTWISSDDELLAFDFGPGNGLIDDWVGLHTDLTYDHNGDFAATGNPDADVLSKMLEHPFFKLPPPKSLDRKDFVTDSLDHLSLSDGAATLTLFTAKALALAHVQFPQPANSWIICGGGAHNPVLMNFIERELTGQSGTFGVFRADDIGWNGDFIEAEAFAYLAVRSLRQLPITFPGTTGVDHSMSGGRLARASA